MRIIIFLTTSLVLVVSSISNIYSQKITIPSFQQDFYKANSETMVFDSISSNKGKALIVLDLNPTNPTITIDHGNQPLTTRITNVSLPGKQSSIITSITIKFTDNDGISNYAIYKFNENIEFSTFEFNYMSIKTLYQIYDPSKELQKQMKTRLGNLRESIKK